jgi:hypothetical protein
VALGQVFSEYVGFPCQFALHRLVYNHHHHLSSGAGTIFQTVAAVPRDLVSPHEEEKRLVRKLRNLNGMHPVVCVCIYIYIYIYISGHDVA